MGHAEATEDLLEHFAYEHLPPFLQDVSRPFAELASKVATQAPNDTRETVVALRKLLEAKDAAVRSVLRSEKRRKKAKEVSDAVEAQMQATRKSTPPDIA